jgi:hypothetical protein
MEDAQGTHSHEEEVMGINIILGNEEIQSNCHKSRVELVELVETIKILRKYRATRLIMRE